MIKRGAHTLMALAVAIIVTQILCTGLILRGQERTRKEAEAAQASAEDVLLMQKQARDAAYPGWVAAQAVSEERNRAVAELADLKERLAETEARLDQAGTQLDRLDHAPDARSGAENSWRLSIQSFAGKR